MDAEDIAFWGMTAEWFAAVGTVGALLLGFTLFANERRQAKRAAADAFVIWSIHQSKADDGRPEIDFYYHNAGTTPVFNPALITQPRRHGYQILAYLTADVAPLMPGQYGHARIAFTDMSEGWKSFLSFTDGSGREWYRDMASRRYVRRPRHRWWHSVWYKIRYKGSPPIGLFMDMERHERPAPTVTSLAVSSGSSR